MGNRGRPINSGTKNKGRKNGRHLVASIPPMPQDLSPVAQAHWNTITQQLYEAGYLTDLDGVSMRLLAESLEIYIEAVDDVRQNGIKLQTQKGWMANPALGAKNTAWKQIHVICKQYVMSVSARNGVKGNDHEEDDDTESVVFGIVS